MAPKTPKETDPKRHNPTPKERDERFSLYGMDPEKVIEAVLLTPPKNEDKLPPKRKRTKSAPRG